MHRPGERLEERFERERPRLRAVAQRLLGSAGDADDAVQEAWLRLQRADGGAGVEDLPAWLTTVVARISLNVLRSRAARREEPLDARVPDPSVGPAAPEPGPEDEALAADAVGAALLVVLEALTPAERLAFVLHDVFAVPFDEVGRVVDRSPEAARQLASRARRRVRAAATEPGAGAPAQRAVVDAFFAAGRDGRLADLVAVLDPGVVLRADFGPGRVAVARGPEAVADRAALGAATGREVRPAVVDGTAGAVVLAGGRPVAVMGFTVVAGRIRAIDVLGDPARLARLDLAAVAAGS